MFDNFPVLAGTGPAGDGAVISGVGGSVWSLWSQAARGKHLHLITANTRPGSEVRHTITILPSHSLIQDSQLKWFAGI